MTIPRNFRHEYLLATIWVLAALLQAVAVSAIFLRGEPVSATTTLWSLLIIVGMTWSLTRLPRS